MPLPQNEEFWGKEAISKGHWLFYECVSFEKRVLAVLAFRRTPPQRCRQAERGCKSRSWT
eukprot:4847954-Amphidinium_carterae.1